MSSDAPTSDHVITLPERPMTSLVVSTLVFAFLGPLVGALLGVVMLALFAMAGSEIGFGQALAGLFADATDSGLLPLYFAPFWALVPAVLLGAFFGWHQGWRGPVPTVGGVLAGAGVGAVYFLVSEFFGLGAGLYGASFSVVISGLVVLLLLPVLRLLASRQGKATVGRDA